MGEREGVRRELGCGVRTPKPKTKSRNKKRGPRPRHEVRASGAQEPGYLRGQPGEGEGRVGATGVAVAFVVSFC